MSKKSKICVTKLKSRTAANALIHCSGDEDIFIDGTCKLIDLDIEELEKPIESGTLEQENSPGFFSCMRTWVFL